MGPAVMRNPNQQILDEVNASNVWFHAKKVYAIWAKEVEQEQTVQTLEGDEQVRPGDFLCRGAGGEVWPQRAESLQSKYDATEEIDENGWRKFTPKPDDKGVFAAHVDHLFAVQASWGTLRGKPGDYLLKGFDDKDVEYPQDVWIVDKDLFAATYEKVEP